MARDVCADCEGDFPFGEGLKDGRCPDCRAIFREGRAEARKAARPEPKPEPKPAAEPEPEPAAESEPAEGEQEEE